MPTILEVSKVEMPSSVNGVTQKPLDGSSLAYTFDDAKVASKHTTQYFEMFGNRAIYDNGWIAATTPAGVPWSSIAPQTDPITGHKWELYHVSEDFSEANDLAATMPDKLKEMQFLFYTEAAKNNVLPIDNDRTQRLNPAMRPSLTRGRTGPDLAFWNIIAR